MNNNQQQAPQQYRVRINKYIKAPQVRVILSDGSNGGIMNTWEAIKLAQDEGFDLIEINSRSVPVVCRIADYGHMKYEEKKKAQAEKKKQHVQQLKEIVLKPAIALNDISHKIVHAREFLEQNHRVRLSVRYRGRELAHQNIGKEKLEYFIQQLEGLIQPVGPITLEGKIMSVMIQPLKK